MTANIDWLKASPQWGRTVAESTATSAEILRILASHADNEVREAVAENINAPLDIVLTLACDKSPDLRYAIAENHNIHADVLNLLSLDSNPFVSHRAKQTLDRIQGVTLLQFPIVQVESVVSMSMQLPQ